MCSNYRFPSKKQLTLFDIKKDQLELELKDHVYSGYHAPIIMKGFDFDFGKFGLHSINSNI